MGYTHYWETKKKLTPEQWKKVQKKARGLIAKARRRGICVAGGDGHGKPSITAQEIVLNGCARDDEDHETFFLTPKKADFDFCKTNQKPYDALAVSILNETRKIAPWNFAPSSDGGPEAIKTVLKGLGGKKRR